MSVRTFRHYLMTPSRTSTASLTARGPFGFGRRPERRLIVTGLVFPAPSRELSLTVDLSVSFTALRVAEKLGSEKLTRPVYAARGN